MSSVCGRGVVRVWSEPVRRAVLCFVSASLLLFKGGSDLLFHPLPVTGLATEVIFWPAAASLAPPSTAAAPSTVDSDEPPTAAPPYDFYEAKGVVFPTLMNHAQTSAYQELDKLGDIYPDVISALESTHDLAFETWVFESDNNGVGVSHVSRLYYALPSH